MPASSTPAGASRDIRSRCSTVIGVAGMLCAAAGLACSGPSLDHASSEAARFLQVRLSPRRDAALPQTIDVVGLPADALSTLREAALTPEEWAGWLRISVAGSGENVWDQPPVLGTYAVSHDAIHFSPLFDFDPGRSYRVVFDPARLPPRLNGVRGAWRSRLIEETVREPAPEQRPATTVVEVYPTADVVPENLLRLYISFSAPMSGVGQIMSTCWTGTARSSRIRFCRWISRSGTEPHEIHAATRLNRTGFVGGLFP